MAIAINRKGMRICETIKNNDKILSELKDQGNKLQQEKNDAASDEVIKKIINNDAKMMAIVMKTGWMGEGCNKLT
jgi:glutamate-1-semialdehyde aminotransferase